MVVWPYKDRLKLFSKYLQQLMMESLGKELDLIRNVVNQGITVPGNKGSTNQHSYVQQLREGLNDFFATFIEVSKDERDKSLIVEPKITTDDFLHGFYLGTRQAPAENGRDCISITIKEVSPFTVGMLIALFERAVGFYASLVNINAYYQPGVEAGKKAASNVILVQSQIIQFLRTIPVKPFLSAQLQTELNIKSTDDIELVFKICEHLSLNPDRTFERRLQIQCLRQNMV